MLDFFSKKRIKGWLSRYTYPMLYATLAEFLAAILVYEFSRNYVVAALAATIAGSAVFYVFMAYKEIKDRKTKEKKLTVMGILRSTRNLMIEFGPAEYLDSYALRPVLLAICPMFISPYFLGALVGAIIAELVYAIIVLFCYETRKKIIKD